MDGTAKKISFGFSKLQKQPAVGRTKPPKSEDKVEYIDCLESKTIKVKSDVENSSDTQDKNEEHVKVIPLRKNTIGFLSKEHVDENQPEDNSLESLAAREILQESKETRKEVISAPLVIEHKLEEAVDIKKESTLEDYEAVPISSFGMAMLRGMGWDPTKGVGKNEKKVKVFEPTLRPKGLGLGAGKQIGDNADGEDSSVELGSFVKVLGKATSEVTGEVVSFDEDSGRLVIKKPDGSFSSVHEMMVKVIKKNNNLGGSSKRVTEANSLTTKKHKHR